MTGSCEFRVLWTQAASVVGDNPVETGVGPFTREQAQEIYSDYLSHRDKTDVRIVDANGEQVHP